MGFSESLRRTTVVKEIGASGHSRLLAHPRLIERRGREHTPDPDRPLGRSPQAGDRLGPYELCLELATGGMATVYLARRVEQGGLHRYVALKCIRPALAETENFVAMFFDEARIASQIQHANVCAVIDFDEARGIYYLAMEFMRGETLGAMRRRLADRQEEADPFQEAGLIARIMTDAAEGLHAAHELRGANDEPLCVVHRDVSPENILVTYDGVAKVMDFGIASASHQRHQTRTGMLKGKYCYIQPEVLKGERADRRADLWGLGVVTWELLTRQKLFAGDSEVEVLQAVANREIPPPSTLRAGLPIAIDDIVMRCLHRDPDRRYQTARELGRHLTRFQVEHRLAIGLAEISDFMTELFPAGPACKQQLVEVAEKTAVARELRAGEERADRSEVAESVQIESGPVSTPVDSQLLPNWRRQMAAAAVLAATLLIALFIGLGWRGAEAGSAETAPAAHPGLAPAGSDADYRLEISALPAAEPGTARLELRVVGGPERLCEPAAP